MHSKRIARNTITNFFLKIITLFISFVSRRIIIMYLGENVLGLGSLYSNVLNLLNLADLGIGVAIQYLLYQPIVDKDTERISGILYVAKRVFTYIGLIILGLGFFLSFFLDLIIKDNTFDDAFIRISFMINVFGVSSSYFFVYKRLFFQANEESHICDKYDSILTVLLSIIKIIVVILTKNYFLYLVLTVSTSLFSNFLISYEYDRIYSNMIQKPDENIDYYYKLIFQKVKSIIPDKICGFINSSTDTILLSMFLGLIAVARYNNYYLLTTSAMTVAGILAITMTSSFGKLIKEVSRETVYENFRTYSLLQFFFSSIVSCALLVTLSPIVSIWMGKESMLSDSIMVVMVIDFYLQSMCYPLNTVTGAAGMFEKEKIIVFFAASTNIIVSIVLGKILGMFGLVVGTIIATLINFVLRTKYIVEGFFMHRAISYYLDNLFFSLITVMELAFCHMLCNHLFQSISIIWVIARGCIAIGVSAGINYLIFRKDDRFTAIVNKIKGIIKQ